jgi:hypothetical protein
MPRFKRSAHRVSLTAMFASMSLLFLYLAAIPGNPVSMAMYFLSSVFVMGLVLEEEIGLAFLMFAVVSLLSLPLMGLQLYVIPYVLFFGHYGIGKYYIETGIRDKIIRYIIKLLYYNVALVLIYIVTLFVNTDVLSNVMFFDVLPLYFLIPLAEVAFVVYDFLFTKVTAYYFNHIRRLLMKD